MWYKDDNKSSCNIYIFFMTKVLCSGRCYKCKLATRGSKSPMLQMMSAMSSVPVLLGTEWVAGSSLGQNEGEGICPSMSLPWKGWVLLLRGYGGQGGKCCWNGEETHAEAPLDAAEEEVPVPGLLLLLYLSSASSPSSFSSRGLSTLRFLCSASPDLLRSLGLSAGTAYSVRKRT